MYGNTVTHDIERFKEESCVIVANRMDSCLADVQGVHLRCLPS